jgi:hypothetical protein
MAEYDMGPDFERVVTKPPKKKPWVRKSSGRKEVSEKPHSRLSPLKDSPVAVGEWTGSVTSGSAGRSMGTDLPEQPILVASKSEESIDENSTKIGDDVEEEQNEEVDVATPPLPVVVQTSLAEEEEDIEKEEEEEEEEEEKSLPSQSLESGLMQRLTVMTPIKLSDPAAGEVISPDRTEKTVPVEYSPTHGGGGGGGGADDMDPESLIYARRDDRPPSMIIVGGPLVTLRKEIDVEDEKGAAEPPKSFCHTLMHEKKLRRIVLVLLVVLFIAVTVAIVSLVGYGKDSNNTSTSESASTDNAVASTAPSMLRYTPSPTSEPSSRPTRSPMTSAPIISDDCVDDSSATVWISTDEGEQTCAWLATMPGHRDRVCGVFAETRVTCCATCEGVDIRTDSTTTTTTDEPTEAPVETNEPTLQSGTDEPTLSPTIGGTEEVTAAAAEAGSMVQQAILARASTGTSAALADSGSVQYKAMQWVEENASNQGEQFIQNAFGLATFAYTTSYGGWSNNGGWLVSGSSHCEWYGVTCDSNGFVTQLSLRGNGVKGGLPSELTYLSETLEVLDLGENKLTGKLPSEYGKQLKKLQSLILDNNFMSGSLPGSIGSFVSLQILHLQYNSFSGSVPDSIASLSNISELYLWHNGLSGTLTSEVCTLSNLNALDIDCDELAVDCWTACYYQCGDNGVDCDPEFQPDFSNRI